MVSEGIMSSENTPFPRALYDEVAELLGKGVLHPRLERWLLHQRAKCRQAEDASLTLADLIIADLNRLTGYNYSPRSVNTQKLLRVLLDAGYTAADVRAVQAAKVAEWGKDVKMAHFLQPSTLYRLTNFAKYFEALTAQQRKSIAAPQGGKRGW
jgi:uncharacterized phage protein (TIGR02220 family)